MLRYVLEPGATQRPAGAAQEGADPEVVLEELSKTTVGADAKVRTPFGSRRLVYADYTASGRASTIVEDFIRERVLPLYGNTHTLSTATARQTTYLRAEAREVIRHHLNATHEDAVIFAGNGSTGAAHLFVQALQRAAFAVRRASDGGQVCSPCRSVAGGGGDGSSLRDMYYREDRWGGGECVLCGVRVKSAAIYQAHQHSEAHRTRLRAAEEGSTGGSNALSSGEVQAQLPPRRIVVLTDSVLHHSSSLPFRELLPQYPLVGEPALASFPGSSYCRQKLEDGNEEKQVEQKGGRASGSSEVATSAGPAKQRRLEVELSNLPIDAATGLVDETQLQSRLQYLRSWCYGDGDVVAAQQPELVVICMLAASSNITGLCVDVPGVTSLARRALPGAIICWDFASAAGHKSCNLNPAGNSLAAVDAAFFSPHKLWGGPGSVGVLAVKKHLLCNAVPAVTGGGVVFFVSDGGHSYIQNSEEREEAGTPNILGSIRAGLAHHLLDQLPPGAVEAREQVMLGRVLEGWSRNPRIEVLGPAKGCGGTGPERTGVISFMVRYGNASPGLYLHYNFVAALLNDLFGVQARGGCACAGPYAQWLLGIGPELAADFDSCLARTAQEVFRPGFVRVGVHWAMTDEDVEALMASVLWIAEHGWRLLAAYTFDRETGEWLHRLDVPERRRLWLSSIRVGDVGAEGHGSSAVLPGPIAELETTLGLGAEHASSAEMDVPRGRDALLAAADTALSEAYGSSQVALSSSKWPGLDANFAHLLWFALPADVAFSIRSTQPGKPQLASGVDGGIFLVVDTPPERPVHAVLDASSAHGAAGVSAAQTDMHQEPEQLEDVADDWLALPEDDDSEQDEAGATAPCFSKIAVKPSIPKPLRGLVGRAIADFGMITEGDGVLVGLSGGKDSLTVLHVLMALQKNSPVKFRLAAATVDPMTPEYNPAPLREYLEALGVEYHVLQKPIIELAKTCIDPKKPSLCAFCSRMKRGMLYSCMREHGFSVLVLGQHLDDFAESFFMSAVHNGLLRTMKAHYRVAQEDVRVCRPLIYVRESQTAEFARENQLPIIADNCPACFAAPKERHKTKLLLSSLEFDYPQLFGTLLRTMRPLYSQATANRSEPLALGASSSGGGVGAANEEDDADEQQQLSATGPSRHATTNRNEVRGVDEPAVALTPAGPQRPLMKGPGGKKNGAVTRPRVKARATAVEAEEDEAAELVLSACGVQEGGGCCAVAPDPPAQSAAAAAAAAAGERTLEGSMAGSWPAAPETLVEERQQQQSSSCSSYGPWQLDHLFVAGAGLAAGLALGVTVTSRLLASGRAGSWQP